MRYLILFVAIFTSTGCLIPAPEPYDFEAPYSCQIPVIGEVNFDYEPDCTVAAYNFELARRILTTAPVRPGERIWVTEAEFKQYFAGMPFKISSRKNFKFGDKTVIGMWNFAHGIVLGSNTKAMVHEMVHEILYQLAYDISNDHSNWDANGALKAANLYIDEYESPNPTVTEPVDRINDVE